MKHFMVGALLLLCGCASLEPPDASYTLPALISQTPLPAWPYQNIPAEVTLTVKVRIGTNGAVERAILLSTSGDAAWDSLATSMIRTWQYAPAVVNGQSVAMWVQQNMRVRFEKPILVPLAEIVCDDPRLADSLYALLLAGGSFDSLARKFSVSTSRTHGGYLGETDLRTLPDEIRTEVTRLKKSGITKPLTLGRQYVIYRRTPSGV